MCIRDRIYIGQIDPPGALFIHRAAEESGDQTGDLPGGLIAVSYTHLRAHETVLDLVCRLLLEKKKPHVTTAIIITYATASNTTHHQIKVSPTAVTM